MSDPQLICPTCGQVLADGERVCPKDHGVTGGVYGVPAEILESTPRAKRHLLGVTVGDAYIINGYLGSGGFGAVYRAEQKALGRDVALKLLMLDMVGDETVIHRFKREARTAAQILDPNVVTLFDYGEASVGPADEDQVLYIAMELVYGPTLRQLIKRQGGLGLEGALQISLNVLRGLAAAHQLGVVHRDLKPGNVLIDESKNRQWFARLFDFGIASLQGSGGHTTQMGQGGVLGTPKYMAPEQWRAQQTAPCTDVYAFGVILAESLLGQPPVPKMELVEMAAAHCRGERPDITRTSKGEDVPLALTEFIKKCMAIDPRQRYSNAREALTALEAIAAGQAAPLPRATQFPEPGSQEPGDESRSSSASISALTPPPIPGTRPPLPPPADASGAIRAGDPSEIIEVRLEEPRRIWPWALALVGLVLAFVGWRLADALLAKPTPVDPAAPTAPATAALAAKASDTAIPDATSPAAAIPDAASPDAASPDAAPDPPDAAPDATPPDAASRPAAAAEKPRPGRAKAPVETRAAPSAPPTAAATEPPRLVARRVGGFDVTPKANPTASDIALAGAEYIRGVDAQKRGAPKAAQRYLVKALKLGLSGAEADDAQRLLRQLADQVALEASEF